MSIEFHFVLHNGCLSILRFTGQFFFAWAGGDDFGLCGFRPAFGLRNSGHHCWSNQFGATGSCVKYQSVVVSDVVNQVCMVHHKGVQFGELFSIL